MVWGVPPRVILVQAGNCTTTQIERLVRTNAIRLAEFENDGKRSLLLLK
jgi:predicted nuclease of predicted toxin-antitoxin system